MTEICAEAVELEQLVEDMTLEIITPDKYTEYSETITDVQPIAAKVEGDLGHGITRVLDGVVMVVTGTDANGVQIGEFGSSEGELDRNIMWGRPGAPDKVVVCNHASNVTGNLLDIEWIKRFCHKHHLYLILDISQTAGHLPIDLSDGKVAAACFTGHKALHGPQGTGGICIHKKLKLTPIITGGDGMKSFSKEQPDELPAMLEAGTANVPGIAGLAASVGWLMSQETPSLGNYFYQEATKISELTFYGDFTKEHIDVFSLNIRSAESALISDILWEEFGIATRSGYHCSPLIHQYLGTKNTGTVRISLSRFTTEEEIEKNIKALRIIAKR